MKHVIHIQHPRGQTIIAIPKALTKVTRFGESKLGRIWINEIGNLEIEVLNLDENKNRHPGVSPNNQTY